MRHEAIMNLYTNVHNQVGNKAFDVEGKPIVIDEAKVAEEIKRLKADYDSKKYQRDRLAEYPSIQECIHAILDDDLTALQAKRKLIKDKYPKP
jgi:hypothetical protein